MKKYFQFLIPPSREPLEQDKVLYISIFAGFLGIDRYLLGYPKWWLKPLTLGGLWIWYLYDIILLALGKLTMFDGKALKQ